MSSGSASVPARLASRGADVVLVAVRELRLLLGLMLVLFLTSETWRYIGRLSVGRLLVLVLVTMAASWLVVVLGLARTVGRDVIKTATGRLAAEVTVFAVVVFLGFTLLGTTTMDAELVAEWSGSREVVLASLGVGDPTLVITVPLIKVAGLLAALGALAFAVEVVVDPAARNALLHDLTSPGS